MELPDLGSNEGLQFLDEYLKDKSYISGFHPSQADTQVWGKLQGTPSDIYQNLTRWYNNISSYGQDKKGLPSCDLVLKFAQSDKVEVHRKIKI